MIATIILISNGVKDNFKKKKQHLMLEQRNEVEVNVTRRGVE